MRGILTIATFLSIILFPFHYAVLLALVTAYSEPFVPLAAGLFADTLYYTPHAYAVPYFTLGGALITGMTLFVQSRLRSSSMKR